MEKGAAFSWCFLSADKSTQAPPRGNGHAWDSQSSPTPAPPSSPPSHSAPLLTPQAGRYPSCGSSTSQRQGSDFLTKSPRFPGADTVPKAAGSSLWQDGNAGGTLSLGVSRGGGRLQDGGAAGASAANRSSRSPLLPQVTVNHAKRR